MKLNEYGKLACVTESVVPEVDGRNSRLLHGLIGLSTEIGEVLDALKRHYFYVEKDGTRKELDLVNLREEVGDLMWYCAIICSEKGIKFEDKVGQSQAKPIDGNSLYETAVIANMMFGNNLLMFTDSGEFVIEPIFDILNELVVCLDGDWTEIATSNIEKLKTRFKGKSYNPFDAYNRDLETERTILEK